jgi:hypothetical protein
MTIWLNRFRSRKSVRGWTQGSHPMAGSTGWATRCHVNDISSGVKVRIEVGGDAGVVLNNKYSHVIYLIKRYKGQVSQAALCCDDVQMDLVALKVERNGRTAVLSARPVLKLQPVVVFAGR